MPLILHWPSMLQGGGRIQIGEDLRAGVVDGGGIVGGECLVDAGAESGDQAVADGVV